MDVVCGVLSHGMPHDSCDDRPWEDLKTSDGVTFGGATLCHPTANGRWPFRIHCLIKLLDKDSRVISMGVLPVGRLQFLSHKRQDEQLSPIMTPQGHYDPREPDPVEARIEIEMTLGGQPRGLLHITAAATARSAVNCPILRTCEDLLTYARYL